jgi:hypothetical protein
MPDEYERHDRLRRARRLAEDLGARYAPERVRLAGYVCTDDRQLAAARRLKLLLPRLGELSAAGRGLVWWGQVGTGKDHLMAGALYRAAWDHGLACRFLAAAELWRLLRDAMDAGRPEGEVLAPYWFCGVLGVSDPAPADGEPARWQREQFAALVDRRYRRGLPTWVTCNAASEADFRALLGPPTADRLLEGAEVFECFWPSYRRRKE